MASEEARIYATIFANFPSGSVSDEDWRALIAQAKTKTLSAAIIAAAQARNGGAQNYITARKRSQNATYLLLYTLVGFELDRGDVDALLALLDTEAAQWGVSGTPIQKFEGVLQAELRAAAADLGYNATAQGKLSFSLINQSGYTIDIDGVTYGTFKREAAIVQAQAYLATNVSIWYE